MAKVRKRLAIKTSIQRRPKSPLEALDGDGNGMLSRAEIAKAVEALMKMDQNGDGELSQEELRGETPPPTEKRRAPSK